MKIASSSELGLTSYLRIRAYGFLINTPFTFNLPLLIISPSSLTYLFVPHIFPSLKM